MPSKQHCLRTCQVNAMSCFACCLGQRLHNVWPWLGLGATLVRLGKCGLCAAMYDELSGVQQALEALQALVHPHFGAPLAKATMPLVNRIGSNHLEHSLWSTVRSMSPCRYS